MDKNLHSIQDIHGRHRGVVDGLPAEYVNYFDLSLDRDDIFILSLFNLVFYPTLLSPGETDAPLSFTPLREHTPSARVAMSLGAAEILGKALMAQAADVRKRYGLPDGGK